MLDAGSPSSVDLYTAAITHPTWAREQGGENNQRLEFLGDAVLKLLVAELLYDRMPGEDEGGMSNALHQLVDNDLLAEIARERGLGSLLRLGVGEERQGGRDRDGNLADLFEALLGAIYLDQGLVAARDVVRVCLGHRIRAARQFCNPRSALQTWAEREGHDVPHYRVVGVSGPDHERTFQAEVWVGDARVGAGEGTRKRKAFVAAAAAALDALEIPEPDGGA